MNNELTNEAHGDENYKDAHMYQGCEEHLVEAGVTADAAEYSQERLYFALCDEASDAACDVLNHIGDCEELRGLLFKVLNVGCPSNTNQRDLIHKLEIKIAKEYDK